MFAAPGFADEPPVRPVMAAAFGGGVLVLGWLLLPLVFFGVDETLDPARFALLPLPRRTLVTGLFAAALISVPVFAVLVAVAGLVVSAGAARWRGRPAWCAAARRGRRRAALRRRQPRGDQRVRHHAAVPAGPRPGRRAAGRGRRAARPVAARWCWPRCRRADWDRLVGVARIVGWTPFGAPWTIGLDVAEGRAWAVPVKLMITAVAIGALLLVVVPVAGVGDGRRGAAPARRRPAGRRPAARSPSSSPARSAGPPGPVRRAGGPRGAATGGGTPGGGPT